MGWSEGDVPASDHPTTDSSFVDVALWVAVLFFLAAFIFWVICWTWRKRPESLTVFWFSAVFEFGGFFCLTIWQFTNP